MVFLFLLVSFPVWVGYLSSFSSCIFLRARLAFMDTVLDGWMDGWLGFVLYSSLYPGFEALDDSCCAWNVFNGILLSSDSLRPQ